MVVAPGELRNATLPPFDSDEAALRNDPTFTHQHSAACSCAPKTHGFSRALAGVGISLVSDVITGGHWPRCLLCHEVQVELVDACGAGGCVRPRTWEAGIIIRRRPRSGFL
ncbi:hypothetical protein VTL71DRAFT_7094 [Oculimacula yallundae]|uniref:Uncharacterized protein n=1 Tax=Oculimacula yallundae TaxID=86028 RepID=A0ABR4BWW1_9HELO